MYNRKLSRVLPKQSSKEIIYNVATLINMTMLSIMTLSVAISAYQDDQAKNETNGSSIRPLIGRLVELTFLLGQLFLEYKMFKHEKNKMNLMFDNDLDREVKNSQSIINRKMRYCREEYLERLNLIACDKNEATIIIPKNLLYTVDCNLEVTYTVGEGLIYKQLEQLLKLRSQIIKAKADAKYKLTIAFQESIKEILPYWERGLDMVVKRRYSNLFGVSTLAMILVFNSLFDLNNNNLVANIVLPLTAFLLPLSSIAESYVLKQTTKRLDLEGFHTIHRSVIDELKVAPIGHCITSQLNGEVCYFPNNKTFKTSIELMLSCMQVADTMLNNNDPLLIKQPQLKQDILAFKRNVIVTRDIEKNLVNLHFLSKSQTNKRNIPALDDVAAEVNNNLIKDKQV